MVTLRWEEPIHYYDYTPDTVQRAGFAGQYRKAAAEIDVQPIDQDDVADGKPGEHSEVKSDVGGQMTEVR